jgi:hypothetical protein
MELWITLALCLTAAISSHWLALHPDSEIAEATRTLFWGDPMSRAVFFYLASIAVIVLLLLRLRGIDFVQAYTDLS